jgi:hypothetical protein
MTNKTEDELAALRKRVEELEEKAKPTEPVDWDRLIAEHNDRNHQMREGRMALATPPSVIADLNVLDETLLKGVRGDARAPTGRPGMIPDSGGPRSRTGGGDGSGWAPEIKLGPQPGIYRVDEQCIADDIRQRKERERGG